MLPNAFGTCRRSLRLDKKIFFFTVGILHCRYWWPTSVAWSTPHAKHAPKTSEKGIPKTNSLLHMWIISNISRSHYTKSCSSVVSILVWDYKLSKFYPKLSIIQDVVTWWEGYTCVQQFPVANLNQLEVLVTNFCHCNKVNVSKMITFCCLPWFWLSISKLGFSWICECESKQQCIEYTHL